MSDGDATSSAGPTDGRSPGPADAVGDDDSRRPDLRPADLGAAHDLPTPALRIAYLADRTAVPAVAPPPPVRLEDLVSPAGRLRAAQAAVAVVTAGAIVATVACAYSVVTTIVAAGDDPRGGRAPVGALDVPGRTVDDLDAAGLVVDVATVGTLVLLAIAWVFVVRWQNVVVRNQVALGIRPRYRPLGAALAWLLPFWALFGPKLALDDAWRAADPDATEPGSPGTGTWAARPVPRRFLAWWATWLVSGAVRGLGASLGDGTLAGRAVAYGVVLVGDVLLVASAWLFVDVLHRVTDRHDAVIARAGS